MADTFTANYNFTKPEPGTAGWDGKLNGDLDAIDAEIKNREDEAAALDASKAARPSSSTANNLAALDANGDLIDSGRKISDVNTLTSNFYAHEASTPDMTVTLEAGKLMYAGTLATQPQQSVAITAADATQNRIDRIVIDEQTGSASVIDGILATTPTAPPIPAGKLPVCQVQVDAGTAAITDAIISDERAFFGSGSEVIVLDSDNAQTEVVNTTTITTIYTYTILANTCKAGGKLRLSLLGDYLNNSSLAGSQAFSLGVVFGGTTIANDGATTNGFLGALYAGSAADRNSISACLEISILSTTAQTAQIKGVSTQIAADNIWGLENSSDSGRHGILRDSAIAEDMSTDITLTLRIQHSAADPAISFIKRSVVLEYLP